MKRHIKIMAGAVSIVIILGIIFLYRNTLEDTWAERLTEKNDLIDYLEFYPAGEEDIFPDKGAFIIYNKTDQEMRTGEFYALQKKILGKWCNIETNQPMDFVAIGYGVPPGEYRVIANWEKDYGKLPHGTYRIIKECSLILDTKYHKSLDFTFACEFKI